MHVATSDIISFDSQCILADVNSLLCKIWGVLPGMHVTGQNIVSHLMGRRDAMQVGKRTYEELAEKAAEEAKSQLAPHTFSSRLAWRAIPPLIPQEVSLVMASPL